MSNILKPKLQYQFGFRMFYNDLSFYLIKQQHSDPLAYVLKSLTELSFLLEVRWQIWQFQVRDACNNLSLIATDL